MFGFCIHPDCDEVFEYEDDDDIAEHFSSHHFAIVVGFKSREFTELQHNERSAINHFAIRKEATENNSHYNIWKG